MRARVIALALSAIAGASSVAADERERTVLLDVACRRDEASGALVVRSAVWRMHQVHNWRGRQPFALCLERAPCWRLSLASFDVACEDGSLASLADLVLATPQASGRFVREGDRLAAVLPSRAAARAGRCWPGDGVDTGWTASGLACAPERQVRVQRELIPLPPGYAPLLPRWAISTRRDAERPQSEPRLSSWEPLVERTGEPVAAGGWAPTVVAAADPAVPPPREVVRPGGAATVGTASLGERLWLALFALLGLAALGAPALPRLVRRVRAEASTAAVMSSAAQTAPQEHSAAAAVATAVDDGADGRSAGRIGTDNFELWPLPDGTLGGAVRRGTFTGRELAGLSAAELRVLWWECAGDESGRMAVERLLDERRPGWRAEREAAADRGVEPGKAAEPGTDGHAGSAVAPAPPSLTVDQALEILGFAPASHPTPDEIRAKWRDLSKLLHPDRGGSEHLIKQVNSAKAALQANGVL
jgi:hypothetical protein